MERLASRTAAHKLGQILGLLVVPFLVLWSFYFIKAKSEIDGLSREITGVEFAMLGPADENDKAERQRLADSLGLSSAINVSDQSAAGQARVLTAVARASRLGTDADWQSSALVEVAFFNLPGFDKLLAHAVQNKGSLLLAAGEADALTRRMEENLEQTALEKKPDVAALLSRFQGLTAAVHVAASAAESPFSTVIDGKAELKSLQGSYDDLRGKAIPALKAKVLNTLLDRLQARRASMWQNLLLLTMAGLMSALAGVGLAVLMMRSTFIELDEVEKARSEALTARREAEQLNLRFSMINADISDLNQDLAKKVKELKAAQDELIKKGRLEQLGQLTATIAHEIRNPLGAIRTSIFTLQRKTAQLGADVEGPIQRINNSVNRCDEIISQLLDFSRVKEMHASSALLDEWLVRVVRDEAKRLPQHINIECALGLEDLKIPFDSSLLQRAVVNLLNNACEALANMPEQDLVKGHRHMVTLSTLQRGDMVCIRIADNGPGMPADILQRIREPLFTTKSFGSGLGIPAVEQIVKQHGGHLDISSDVGKGATFTINLPVDGTGQLSNAA